MADFVKLMEASPEDLVRIFYRAKKPETDGFVARINHIASQLGLNHAQLICGLGFNSYLEELVDVLSVLGFSTAKLLKYRRDELFTHDLYAQLSIDDVLDIYTYCMKTAINLSEIERLIPTRLSEIENRLEGSTLPTILVSYKMELHAIYTSHLATETFAQQRIQLKKETDTSRKMWLEEIRLIIDNNVIPAGNLFFSEELSPQEKLVLIESGEINVSMIKNRMQNTTITAAERDMLEDKLN